MSSCVQLPEIQCSSSAPASESQTAGCIAPGLERQSSMKDDSINTSARRCPLNARMTPAHHRIHKLNHGNGTPAYAFSVFVLIWEGSTEWMTWMGRTQHKNTSKREMPQTDVRPAVLAGFAADGPEKAEGSVDTRHTAQTSVQAHGLALRMHEIRPECMQTVDHSLRMSTNTRLRYRQTGRER